MRRSFWIFAVVFILAIGVSSAQAVTFTPTFTCTNSCNTTPTAGDVSFPSPSIFEMWANNVSDFIGLLPGDHPGDTYTWSNSLLPDGITPELADYSLSITDVTTNDSQVITGTIGISDPLFITSISDSGTLTFNSVASAVPEPCTWAMMIPGFAGIGALAYRRRRSAMIPG